jgi:hypothetical protein
MQLGQTKVFFDDEGTDTIPIIAFTASTKSLSDDSVIAKAEMKGV